MEKNRETVYVRACVRACVCVQVGSALAVFESIRSRPARSAAADRPAAE